MSPVPAGSGKSARPVPGRTRDTDHWQRLCRAASAGAVKRGARRHPLSEINILRHSRRFFQMRL
ncbi:TPA: hypothetical protein ACHGIE_005206 [Escherichia coli]